MMQLGRLLTASKVISPGLSEDGTQAVMRLVSDNDLIWDFVLPMEAVQRLRDDLTRLENLPRPA